MADQPWFELDGEDAAGEIQRLVNGFKSEQKGRRTRYIRNLELYEGRKLGGYTGHAYQGSGETDDGTNELDRMRLIRSAVASAVANIYGPQKPKPQFQTMGATWAVRRKAYRLDRICEGIINQRQGRWQNVWTFMMDAGTEAALQGTAAIKVTSDRKRKRIVHRLALLPDLFVDPAEGREPQNLFERAPIDVWSAIKLYPKAKQAILSAKEYEWFGLAPSSRPRGAKIIEITYAWRLPFGPDEPGRYVAQINGTVVEDEEWIAPSFPFVFLQWEPHRTGFWASGIGDEGGDLAQQCGELDLRLYYRELIASGQTIYYAKDSVKVDDLLMNEARKAVPYDGATPPVETTSNPFHPTELQYLQTKTSAYWDSIGVSQVSASARREQGITSAVGQTTVNELKAGRQLIKSKRFEESFVDLANQYVWRLRELGEEDPDFAVTWPGKSLLRQIKWKEADVEDDMFSVTVAPASALPHDPAGRQDMVETLYKSGFISQETAKSLIGWPDLDKELDTENAEVEYIDMLIETYLDADQEAWSAGDYQSPLAYLMNKMGAMRRFASAWFRAKIDQSTLPQEERDKVEFNLGLLSRYMKELDGLMAPAPQPAGPQVAPDQLAAPPQGMAA